MAFAFAWSLIFLTLPMAQLIGSETALIKFLMAGDQVEEDARQRAAAVMALGAPNLARMRR